MCRRIMLFLFLCFFEVGAFAQFKTEVKITSISNTAISQTMEKASVAIIDAINSAFQNNATPVNPDKSLIEKAAFDNILSLWGVSHFKITENQIISDGLSLPVGGYQVRNIPIFLKEESAETQDREIAFSYDKSGKITDCFLCLEQNSWKSFFVSSNNSVTDLRRRQIILDFVEKFRTAYNTKDLDLINKVFSEDALIITGKVVKQVHSSGKDVLSASNIPTETVEFVRQKKGQYLEKLKHIFAANQYIKVDFDSIEIVQGKQDKEMYGVTLWQSWATKGNNKEYSDKGWLFLLIDFKAEDTPLIYVRTWQPGELNNVHFPRNGVFRMSDFNIEK